MGTIEAVDPGFAGPPLGARVFGLTDFYRDGGAAEFVAVRADDLAEWPASLDPVLAAALPLSGLTAWQALFDHGHLVAGERVSSMAPPEASAASPSSSRTLKAPT